MIVVKLSGGLGNQLFQYAFGIGLSKAKNTTVLFDTSWYKRNKDRNLEVQNVVGEIKIASTHDIAKILYPKNKIMFLLSFTNHFVWKLSPLHIVEKNFFEFNQKAYEEIPTSCYLDGYWQNEGYFTHIKEYILNTYKLKKPLSKQDLEWSAMMIHTNSVSVHIRRGDYVKSGMEAICDLRYFEKAMGIASNKIRDAKFFIFTDDPDWAIEHFGGKENISIVSSLNKKSPEIDLLMMSLCQNNIIANSSYSWWGAWLNKNSKKLVLAPLKWNNDENKRSPVLDTWIKINNI